MLTHLKKIAILGFFVALLTIIVLVSNFVIVELPIEKIERLNDQTFYVGVTYSGNNVTEAKILVDRVKNFTNLLVIQSGPLQENASAIIEICNYAAESGLHTLVYFSASQNRQQLVTSFLSKVQSWQSDLGIYFDDEPGGKMIDNGWAVQMYDPQTQSTIVKQDPQHIYVTRPDMDLRYTFDNQKGWSVLMTISNTTGTIPNSPIKNFIHYRFESNGTIYLVRNNVASQINDTSNLPLKSFQEAMTYQPFQTYDQAKQIFVNNYQCNIDWLKNQKPVKTFTSDYGLYWFDYESGYDVVLAQLGWNNSLAQEIGLVRGAAAMNNKDWGTILTWKYSKAPYLGSGEELFQQMNASYLAGAKYVVLFNYAEDMKGPFGTLQNEHFDALERFWNQVVKNSSIQQGSIKAEAAFVLPKNYGFGLRNPSDSIWGFWPADNQSPGVYTNLQNALSKYGSRLDIVYNDAAFPVDGKYNQIYYWNQTD